MSLSALALMLAGLVVLTGGAEMLVRGAGRMAGRLRIPPLVVGLTVVAFGTSSPELAVSIKASLGGSTGLALGNVVGSNIFNILFILGLSALAAPLVVDRQLVRLDVPVMIGVSALPLLLGLNGVLGRMEGLLFLAAGVAYTGVLIRLGLRGRSISTANAPVFRGPWPVDLVLVAVGLVLLSAGADWLVRGGSELARAFGFSELVIGLTLVSAGTSFPEVATSVMAVLRGERDLAVGNVVGSNVFNVLWVLGGAVLVAPDGIVIPPGVLTFDFPVMLAVAVACLPIFFTGWKLSRWEGAIFLFYYAVYVTYLLLHASGHEAQDEFGLVILAFVLPLTVLTAAVCWYRERGAHRVRRE